MLMPSAPPMSTCTFSHVPDSCLRPIDLYTHLTCIYICRDRRGWVHGECHGPLRLGTAATRQARPMHVMGHFQMVVARGPYFHTMGCLQPHRPKMSEANLFSRLVWITTSVRGTNAIEMHLNANDTRSSKHSSAISQRYGTHGLSSRSKYHVTLCTPSRHIDTPSICSLPARPSRLSWPLGPPRELPDVARHSTCVYSPCIPCATVEAVVREALFLEGDGRMRTR